MYKLILLAFLCTLVIAHPSSAATKQDKELSAKLVGKWQVRYEDKKNKSSSIAWTVYAANGMASSRSISKIGDRTINLVLEAKWEITDGVLVMKVTKSSDTKIVKVGSQTKDRIVSLTSKEFKYIDQDKLSVTEIRVPNDKAKR